jgi:hypothetical protein
LARKQPEHSQWHSSGDGDKSLRNEPQQLPKMPAFGAPGITSMGSLGKVDEVEVIVEGLKSNREWNHLAQSIR